MGVAHRPLLVSENYSDCLFVWYQNIRSASFSFATIHASDRQTDGQTKLREQYSALQYTQLHGENWTYLRENTHAHTKLKAEPSGLSSPVRTAHNERAHNCKQLWYKIQHRTVLKIFPLTITAEMLSTGEQLATDKHNKM